MPYISHQDYLRNFMQKERFKISAYVSLILRKNNEILLIRRYQTGCDDGFYGCAGGCIDGNEPASHAIIREAREELGITLKQEHLKIVHVLHRKNRQDLETIGFFIEATEWEGRPQNIEPHKCNDLIWCTLDALPQNTQPHFKHVLDMLHKNAFYSEFGWD